MLKLAADYALIGLIVFYSIVLASLILFSFPYLVRWYDFITPPALTKACESNSDLGTGRVVENVEGYFDDSGHGCNYFCAAELKKKIYSFVEASVTQEFLNKGNVSSHGDYNDPPSYRNLVTNPGLFRFTLETRGHPNCRNWEDMIKVPSIGLDYELPDGLCIATIPIDSISSHFTVKMEHETHEHLSGTLLRKKLHIHNRLTGETLRQVVKHRYIVVRPLSGGIRDSLSCRNEVSVPHWVIREVLLPATTN